MYHFDHNILDVDFEKELEDNQKEIEYFKQHQYSEIVKEIMTNLDLKLFYKRRKYLKEKDFTEIFSALNKREEKKNNDVINEYQNIVSFMVVLVSLSLSLVSVWTIAPAVVALLASTKTKYVSQKHPIFCIVGIIAITFCCLMKYYI